MSRARTTSADPAPSRGTAHLVAHRGEPARWPENSLEGYRAVLAAGARYLETDVQLSADLVPVLCHDDSLARVTGHDLAVCRTRHRDIDRLPAGCAERFGTEFEDYRIARLDALAALLADHPAARAFVELKQASLDGFGAAAVLEAVLPALGAARPQCILIAFDLAALQLARTRCELPIGWIVPRWDGDARIAAEALKPEYLFVEWTLPQPEECLWPGPWRWVAYTCNRATLCRRLFERGFDLVETDQFGRLAAALD
jgi:glycerophosphoryl diester phosphodiesterase